MEMVGLGALAFLATAFLSILVPVAAVWLVVFLVRGAANLVGGVLGAVRGLVHHVVRFVRGMLLDSIQLAGGLLTLAVLVLLSLGNLLVGRLRSAGHYARALEDEGVSVGLSLYRLAVGHPVRFLGLSALTDGVERRLPDLVSRDPVAAARPRKVAFDGYQLVGTLQPGGSGAKLYLARPEAERRAHLEQRGRHVPPQVVIKAFSLDQGSTLPQIVRESRALEAAGRLGLVLEHELTPERFHYVMPFVPGETLDLVTSRLHARGGERGLDPKGTRKVIGYAADLLATLDRFHREGLWHKDIKPGNLIVSEGRVHLVDLGLVTPLQSALTLTTHGTEYFRDPELVRLALQGVKVHEVDGVKFDVYSAGAVLFSMIEGSFPAHGSLSRLTRPCPPALAWIVRRAMADLGSRYGSAAEMGRDLAHLLAADDPREVLPAQLPSMAAGGLGRATAAPQPPLPRWGDRRPSVPSSPAAAFAAGHAAAEAERARAARPEPGSDAGVVTRSAHRAGYARAQARPADPTERRRRRRGVLAALGLVGMTTLIVSGAAVLAVDRVDAHRRTSQSASREARARDRAVRRAFEELSRELSDRTRTDRDGRVASATADSAAAGHGAVLLLPDLRLSSHEGLLRELHTELERDGRQVLSAEDRGTPEERTRTTEWIARARLAVGLANADDPQAQERLGRFVSETEGLDAVLWVAPRDRGGYSLVQVPAAR